MRRVVQRLGAVLADWSRLHRWVLAFSCALGVVYVGNAWSPSSYGHVLKIIGLAGSGPVLGQARPFRSDEWAVTTPLTQATVNNGFARLNATSYYGEDLRSNYGMPIRDWGLVFKPSQWGYLVMPPAWAFSWHYFLLSALFVFGHAHLLRQSGAVPLVAFCSAGALYWCSSVQFFWTSNASLFALFPWLLVLLASRLPPAGRLPLYYWLATSWLIENFYPPYFISFAFAGLVWLLAYRPDLWRLRTLVPIGLVTAAACATAVLYLWDYLAAAATTVYPGQRRTSGGGYPWSLLLTQLWPLEAFDYDFRPRAQFGNIIELGTMGAFATLAIVCAMDLARWRAVLRDRACLVLAGGWAMTVCWMCLPVPSWAGAPLLWNRIPPERMVYASGWLLLLLVLQIASRLGLCLTWRRAAAYAAWVVAGTVVANLATPEAGSIRSHWPVLPALLLMGGAWALARRADVAPLATLCAAGLALNVLAFGRFNPVQPAYPIFERGDSRFVQVLRDHVGPDGTLAVQREGLVGATLNGLGFRAVAHLLPVPPMALWEQRLGPLSPEAGAVLNRYAHIRLAAADRPLLINGVDLVGVPVSRFRDAPRVEVAPARPAASATLLGAVDRVERQGDLVAIRGWAPWNVRGAGRQLLVVAEPPASVEGVFDEERWDVVLATGRSALLLSGFQLRLRWPAGTGHLHSLCVYARDADGESWRQLDDAQAGVRCR